MSTTRSPIAALALAAALAACAPGATPIVTTVSIGTDQAVAKGLSYGFTAQVTRSDGAGRDCTADATWASSDPGIASVAAGVATALAEGTATITATCDGLSGSARLAVTAAALVRVDVAAADPAIPVGAKTRLTATGTYTDGATADLTAAVTWSSSDGAIATVSNDAATAGLASAVAAGTATVRAETSGGIAGTSELAVTDAALVAVTVAPVAPVPVGLGAALLATGAYSDGTAHDLTEAVTWTSSDDTVLTVSNVAGSCGAATGVGAGTATVTATSAAGSQGTVDVTVTVAQLLILDLAPIDPAVVAGTTLALTATGTYTDDSIVDLTPSVTWTSSDPLVVSVSAAGTATALAAGTATITASDPVSGVVGTTTVTVAPADAAPALSYLALSRGSIAGGGTVTGTIVLTRAATSPIEVALSTNGANASVPASVAIPVGADRATFTIATTSPSRKRVRVTIRATYDGVTKTATLNVRR